MTTLTAADIRAIRTQARLTRHAFATLVGRSEQSVKKWETGKARPSSESIDAILAATSRLATPTITGLHENDWDRWQKIRELAGMTPLQMSLVMGVSEDDIAEWERPKRYPTVEHVTRYEQLLNRLTGGQGLKVEKAVSTRWQRIREEAGLSREEMAERLGVAKKLVWEFDTGVTQPSDAQRGAYEALQAG